MASGAATRPTTTSLEDPVPLPTWTPKFLARALGYHHAIEDAGDLTAALEADRADIWAGQSADARKAAANLPEMINFQPGLRGLYRDQVQSTAYLYSLAAAAENNLALDTPERQALYRS
jgi:hypothetical protein